MLTDSAVRVLLIGDVVVMALFALFYLRQRQLTWLPFVGWTIIALGLPVLGPFLVIASRPGRFDPDASFRHDLAQLGSFFQRLLPTPPPRPSRLTKARQRRSRLQK